jgi:HSP20 family protein
MCHHSAYHPYWGRHHHSGQHGKQGFAQWAYPPAAVEENDDHYLIKLFAAGYAKSDFQVRIEGDLLLISADKPDEIPGSFQKRFALNDKIDTGAISAKYEEGILTLTLPKLAGFETVRKDIGIA